MANIKLITEEELNSQLTEKANKTDLDAIKNNTVNIKNADGGFAAGEGARTEYGAGIAVGKDAASTDDAMAVGEKSYAIEGGIAIGTGTAVNEGGIAIGGSAKASDGASNGDGNAIAIGVLAESKGNGIAIGTEAHTTGTCIQLGRGSNQDHRTLKVYDYTLLDKDGKIPAERLPMFVYQCKGLGDIKAISAIINDYFTRPYTIYGEGMKLVVTGTTGVDAYLEINSTTNPGNKRLIVDFSDCVLNPYYDDDEPTTDRWVAISSQTARIDIVGLKWLSYGTTSGLNLDGVDYCNFINCQFENLATANTKNSTFVGCEFIRFCDLLQDCTNNVFCHCISAYVTNAGANCNNVFIGCIFNAFSVDEIGSGVNDLIGCKLGAVSTYSSDTKMVTRLSHCKINSLVQFSAASTVKWNIKGCSFAQSSITINKTNVTSSTADILNDYVYFRRYDNLFNQTIT